MAASYSTGTASGPTDLLQKLVTWLVAQGWTQDASASDGTGWRAHLHKSGLYVNLRSAVNEGIWNYNNFNGYGIGLYLGDGYSGASNWRSQSGGPLFTGTSNTVGAGMLLNSGAVTAYHFFDNGSDHIVVVVEKSPGIFCHMGWGPSLVRTGYATDFPYFWGSASSYYTTSQYVSQPGDLVTSHVPTSPLYVSPNMHSTCYFKVDATTFSGRWVSMTNTTSPSTTQSGYTGKQGRCSADMSGQFPRGEYPGWWNAIGRSWQSAYAGALLLPLHLFVNTASGRWAPVGYPPTVFYTVAVGHGYSAGQVQAIGGVNYMLFPNFAVLKAA